MPSGEELLFGHPGHLMVAPGGEDEPVVAEEGGRVSPALGRFMKHPDDVGGLDRLHGPRRHAQPRVVVDHVEHLVDLPPPNSTWVMSACQVSLGRSATKRLNELFGRFWGERVTNPLALSTRKTVETDGGRL